METDDNIIRNSLKRPHEDQFSNQPILDFATTDFQSRNENGLPPSHSFPFVTGNSSINQINLGVERWNNNSNGLINSTTTNRLESETWSQQQQSNSPHPAASLPTIASVLSRLDSALPTPITVGSKPSNFEYGNGAAARAGKKPRISGQTSKPYNYAPRPIQSNKFKIPNSMEEKPYNYSPHPDKNLSFKEKNDLKVSAVPATIPPYNYLSSPVAPNSHSLSGNGFDYSFATNGSNSILLPHMMMEQQSRSIPTTNPPFNHWPTPSTSTPISNPFQTESTFYPPSNPSIKHGSSQQYLGNNNNNDWSGMEDIPVGNWVWESPPNNREEVIPWTTEQTDWSNPNLPNEPFNSPQTLTEAFSFHKSIYVGNPGAWFCKLCHLPAAQNLPALGSFRSESATPSNKEPIAIIPEIRNHLNICTKLDFQSKQRLILEWGIVVDPSIKLLQQDQKLKQLKRQSNLPPPPPTPPPGPAPVDIPIIQEEPVVIGRPKRITVKPKRILEEDVDSALEYQQLIQDEAAPIKGIRHLEREFKKDHYQPSPILDIPVTQNVREVPMMSSVQNLGLQAEQIGIRVDDEPIPTPIKVKRPYVLKVAPIKSPSPTTTTESIPPVYKPRAPPKRKISSEEDDNFEVVLSDYEDLDEQNFQTSNQTPSSKPWNFNDPAIANNPPIKKKKEKKRVLAVELDEFGEVKVERRPTKHVSSEDRYRDLYAMAGPFRNAKNTTSKERARAVFVQNWLHYSYELSPGGNVCRPAMYKSYLRASKELRMSNEINSASFGKAMRQAFPKIEVRRLGHRGNSTYHYTGIRPANTTEALLIASINREDAPDSDKTTANGNPKSSKKSIIDPVIVNKKSNVMFEESNDYISPCLFSMNPTLYDKPKPKSIVQIKKDELAILMMKRQLSIDANSIIKKSGRLSGVILEELNEEEEIAMGRMAKARPLISLVGDIKRKNPIVIGKRKVINTAIKKKPKSFIHEIGPIQNFSVTIKQDSSAVLRIHHRFSAEDIPSQLRPLKIIRNSTNGVATTCYLFHLEGNVEKLVDGMLQIQFTPSGQPTKEEIILLSLGNGSINAVVTGNDFIWNLENARMRILGKEDLL